MQLAETTYNTTYKQFEESMMGSSQCLCNGRGLEGIRVGGLVACEEVVSALSS